MSSTTRCRARGAVYVFTRNALGQWSQQAYIKASNTETFDSFGFAVALSDDGSRLAVGAPDEDSGANGVNGDDADESRIDSGAVYVFDRDKDGTWTQEAYIKASAGDARDEFGRAVVLSSDGASLAVGAPFEDSASRVINGDETNNAASFAGAVYVFRRSQTALWLQEAYIKPANLDEADYFGGNLAMNADGTVLAVGVPEEDSFANMVDGPAFNNAAPGSGAVYIFASVGSTWAQQAYLKSSNASEADRFGASVDFDATGDIVVVGAPVDRPKGLESGGAVYVFARQGATWVESGVIQPAAPTSPFVAFGSQVAVSSDAARVAASDVGTAWVFETNPIKPAGLGTLAELVAPNAEPADGFGNTIALSADGDTLAVGAPEEDSNAIGIGGDASNNQAEGSGAVYLY